MIRVTVEIDDDAFGAVAMRDPKIDKTISQMTDEELVELVLSRDTDLEEYSRVVEIDRPLHPPSAGNRWHKIVRHFIDGIATTMGHPQSRPKYGRRG